MFTERQIHFPDFFQRYSLPPFNINVFAKKEPTDLFFSPKSFAQKGLKSCESESIQIKCKVSIKLLIFFSASLRSFSMGLSAAAICIKV